MKTIIKGIEHDISDIIECFMDKKFECILTSRKSGGYTINVYAYAKEIEKNPEEVAKEVARLLKEHLVWCEEVEYIKGYVNIEFIDNFYVLLMQEMTNGNPYPQRFQAHIRRQKKIQSLKDTFLRVVEYIKYKFLHPRKSLRSFYWDTIPPLRDFYKSIRLFLNRSIATIRDTKTFFIKRIRTDSIRSFSKNHLKVMNEDWNDKKSLREKSIIEAFNYAYSKAQDREYIPGIDEAIGRIIQYISFEEIIQELKEPRKYIFKNKSLYSWNYHGNKPSDSQEYLKEKKHAPPFL